MDTNLTLELFIGRGMIDKSLAKDIKEEMATSGKELPEVLADFGIIGNCLLYTSRTRNVLKSESEKWLY